MSNDYEGCKRLWQRVAMQAVIDGSLSNPVKQHRFEARMFVRGPVFAAICQQVEISAGNLREGMDDPSMYRKLKAAIGGPEREEVRDAA